MNDSEAFQDRRLGVCYRVKLAYPRPPAGWLKADGRLVCGKLYAKLQQKTKAACMFGVFQIRMLCPPSEPPDELRPGDWIIRALVD